MTNSNYNLWTVELLRCVNNYAVFRVDTDLDEGSLIARSFVTDELKSDSIAIVAFGKLVLNEAIECHKQGVFDD